MKLNGLISALLFGLLAVFLVHNFDSIGQDIGRHLKIGEIIWQTKEIPKTNLFSFTEPDFPFINHHWLSEVIFYGIFSQFGFTGLILLKVFTVLASFLLLFFTVKSLRSGSAGSGFWPASIAFLLSIFIFISRTETRPEIFSYAILSAYLFALFKAKYDPDWKLRIGNRGFSPLWLLPIAQLLWVNLHIYFLIGPLVFIFFVADSLIRPKTSNLRFKKLLLIGCLIILATLINPAGIQGALLPFNILKEYGYSIVENQTLAFLSGFFGFNISVFVFKFSVAMLAIFSVVMIKKTRQRVLELLMFVFFAYAGFKMFRNLPLYAIASFPVSAILLTPYHNERMHSTKKTINWVTGQATDKVLKMGIFVFLVFMIFFVGSGGYYRKISSSKVFGFSVPNGLEQAVNFVKENKIEGPMFNNFDTGGYLIWKLYPGHKVFVDNRPEAYSVKFFNETYKPMQERKEKWAEFSDKYNINFIFFAYSDATPWGETFLGYIVKNPDWRIVYINDAAIILVRDNKNNKEIISNFSISETNAIDRITGNIKNSNADKLRLNTDLSLLFYKINWDRAAIHFADEAIKLNHEIPRPYLFKGFVYARRTDMESQKLAGENIKQAIDLGLKESQYYYILGVVYMNLGRLDEAKLLFQKAVKLDSNNLQAKEFLSKYFK